MSEIGGSNLACPLPFGPIRHAVKRHRPFPCSDPAFAPPVEFRYLFDPENKTDGSAAAAGDVKEESILENFHLMQMIEAEAQKVKAAEWAPSQACPKAVNNGNTPISKTMARRYNKQRVLKNGRHGQRSPVLTAGKRLLTKKFINLIKHAKDGRIDLNQAAETLEVSFYGIFKGI